MTETASRPGTTPAVATLTAAQPQAVTSGEATLAPPTWSWPASAPPDPTKEGLVSDADADERVTGDSSGPPSGEPLEADPTEVTIVAAITTPEKALPKVTSFGPAGKRRSNSRNRGAVDRHARGLQPRLASPHQSRGGQLRHSHARRSRTIDGGSRDPVGDRLAGERRRSGEDRACGRKRRRCHSTRTSRCCRRTDCSQVVC